MGTKWLGLLIIQAKALLTHIMFLDTEAQQKLFKLAVIAIRNRMNPAVNQSMHVGLHNNVQSSCEGSYVK